MFTMLLLAQLGAAAGGAAVHQDAPQQVQGRINYRVIDGALAKKMDSLCAQTWFDNDEVLMIDYRSHTFLMRVNGGDVGRSCKVR